MSKTGAGDQHSSRQPFASTGWTGRGTAYFLFEDLSGATVLPPNEPSTRPHFSLRFHQNLRESSGVSAHSYATSPRERSQQRHLLDERPNVALPSSAGLQQRNRPRLPTAGLKSAHLSFGSQESSNTRRRVKHARGYNMKIPYRGRKMCSVLHNHRRAFSLLWVHALDSAQTPKQTQESRLRCPKAL